MTGKDASKLNERVRDFVGADPIVEFVATCADAIRSFDDIKALKGYENGRNRRIHRLLIRARSKDYAKNVLLTFGGHWRPIDIDMEGPDLAVESHLRRIEETIDGMSPWYAFCAKIDFTSIMMALGAGVAVLGYLWLAVIQGPGRAARSYVLGPHDWGGSLTIAVVALLVALGLNRIRAVIFPKTVFALGQGIQRHKKAELVRIAFLVALAVNILAGIILNWIRR